MHFIRGNHEAYRDTVMMAVQAAAGMATTVVLAQASMAPAAFALRDLGVEVLSSPALSVQRILQQLER